jgi:hypothetical protein
MAIGIGQIAKFVTIFASGDAGLLDKIIQSKLDNLGEDFIKKQLSNKFGAMPSLGLRPHGDFDSLRRAWFTQMQGAASGKGGGNFLEKILSSVDNTRNSKGPPSRGRSGRRGRERWAKTEWARSRQDWLDNKWKHDWRTQPRDAVTGRWLPGRLDQVAADLRYQGSKAGRRTLRRRKLRRKARLSGRRAAKRLFKSLKKR